jgi:hypothetical protein
VHGGGHYAISGDPGSDFYFSALEPGFYLHHGNIDRMHFIWQNLDWENRQVRGIRLAYGLNLRPAKARTVSNRCRPFLAQIPCLTGRLHPRQFSRTTWVLSHLTGM